MKKERLTKRLALFTALTLTGAMLAGCGNTDAAESSSDAQTGVTADTQAAAGDASADGRIADPENFGIDSVRVQRGSDLAQRSVGAAMLMRAAVYKHNFHKKSLQICFLLSYHSSKKKASGTAEQKTAAAFPV